MTLKKAISIVKKTIKKDEQFIEEVREEWRKNPDNSKEQLSANMYRIVIKMAENETNTLKKILTELESRTNSMSKIP